MRKQKYYQLIIKDSDDKFYLKTFIYKYLISYFNLTAELAYFRLPYFEDFVKSYWIKTKDFSTNYKV